MHAYFYFLGTEGKASKDKQRQAKTNKNKLVYSTMLHMCLKFLETTFITPRLRRPAFLAKTLSEVL